MIPYIYLLSIQIHVIDNKSDYIVKLCVDKHCQEKSFIGQLSIDCPDTGEFSNEFPIFGITSDSQFYILHTNGRDRYVNKSCIRNKTEIIPMKVSVTVKTIIEPFFADPYIITPSTRFTDSLKMEPTVIEQPNASEKPSINQTVLTYGNSINQPIETTTSIYKKVFNPFHTSNRRISKPQENGNKSKFELNDDILKSMSSDFEAKTIRTLLNDSLAQSLDYKMQFEYYSIRLKQLIKHIIDKVVHISQMNMPNETEVKQMVKTLTSDRIWLCKTISIIVILVLIYKTYKWFTSNHYYIAKQNLEQLYLERIRILEEEVKKHHIVVEDSKLIEKLNNYEGVIKDLKTSINIHSRRNVEQEDRINELMSILSTKNIDNNNEQSIKVSELQETIDQQEIELESKSQLIASLHQGIHSLDNEANVEKAETDKWIHMYQQSQQYVDSFVKLFLSHPIPHEASVHESIHNLNSLTKNQVLEEIFKISDKLKDYEAFKNESSNMLNLKSTYDTLKDSYHDMEQEMKLLRDALKRSNDEKHELNIGIRAIKDNYKDIEWSLHEQLNNTRQKCKEIEKRFENNTADTSYVPELKKTIDELKRQVYDLEMKSNRMSENHSMELNDQFIVNKKLHRELERTEQERDDYRNKLVKVLQDNQNVENSRDIIVSRRSMTSSKSIEPSVKISSFKNNDVSEESDMPPPPPMLHFPPFAPPFNLPSFNPLSFPPQDPTTRPDYYQFYPMSLNPYANDETSGTQYNLQQNHHSLPPPQH